MTKNPLYTLPLFAFLLLSADLYSQELSNCPERVPAISLTAPDAFRKGYFGVISGGAILQSRTRLTGDFIDPDGNAGFSAGLGDPERLIGIEIRANIFGFTNQVGIPNNAGAGTIEFHLTRQIGEKFWIGGGIYNLTGWNTQPEEELKSYYLTSTTALEVTGKGREDLYITFGLGNGRFRTDGDYTLEEEGNISPFGSVALRVMNEANVFAEWTGYNVAAGFAIFPFKKIPGQLLIGVDDIFNDRWRFMLGGSIGFHLKKYDDRPCVRNFGFYPPPPPQSSRI